MVHIEKADFRLVSDGSGEIFDREIYARLSWLASRHAQSTSSGAELLEGPLSEAAAFEMMDTFGMVSGYLLVDIDEVLGPSKTDVKGLLSTKLVSGVDLAELAFEIVWGHSQTLLLYVCGKTSG